MISQIDNQCGESPAKLSCNPWILSKINQSINCDVYLVLLLVASFLGSENSATVKRCFICVKKWKILLQAQHIDDR